jgi:hypothetical protein
LDVKRFAHLVVLVMCLGNATRVATAGDDQTLPSSSPQPAPTPNKLTLAYYDFSSGRTGVDINLRHTFSTSTAWVGFYREDDGFDQARAGYEYDYHGHGITFVPSAQVASHGFFGATVYGEVGTRVFAIAGAGRTNLEPYWNLGFDPNDYVQFGGGYRDRAGNAVSVYSIHDIRLDTGQTNTHLYFRRYVSADWRLTLDVVRERGTGDDDIEVRSWAASLDVDWRRWFVRVAEDPHVNYTADRQLRVAGGLRF